LPRHDYIVSRNDREENVIMRKQTDDVILESGGEVWYWGAT
jgi:hypothetical protein